MVYNLSYVANSSGVLQFFQRLSSELMQDWWGVLILITLTVIAFIAFIHSTNDPRKSMIGASFLSFAFCLLLRAMSLVPNITIFITLIMAAGSVAITARRN